MTTQCKARVYTGGRDIRGHQCYNEAIEGTNTCKVHTKDTSTSAQASTGTPQVEVSRTITVTLSWDEGGPITKSAYRAKTVQWSTLTVKVSDGEAPERLSGSGVALKQDGSASKVGVTEGYMRMDEFTPEVHEAFEAALREAQDG